MPEKMTSGDASRIQSANVSLTRQIAQLEVDIRLTHFLVQAKSGGDMSSQGFPARAQSAAAHNATAGATSGTAGGSSQRGANSGGASMGGSGKGGSTNGKK
jgi:hypothetical protein